MGFFCFSRSPTIVPARRIYQSRHDAEFKVDVDIKCCVHGYLAKDKKQPASLIIFAPQLVCVENGTFNLFRLEVDFHDQNGSGKPCEPRVASTAPYSVEERLYEEIVDTKNKITKVVKKTKKITATVGAAEAGAKLGLDGQLGSETQKTNEVEYSTKVHYFSKGSSNTRVNEHTDRRYGVWWNVKKSSNPKTGDDAGIPPNYLFAVLLTRANDSTPFEAHFRLYAEAGWAHRREKIVEIVARHLTTKKGPKKVAQKVTKNATTKGAQTATTTPTTQQQEKGSTGSEKKKSLRPSPLLQPPFRRPLSQELADFAAGNYEGRPKPMLFEPQIKFEGDCQGIDRLQLGRYGRPDELARLTMRS